MQRQLDNPVVQVETSDETAMPFFWTNSAYKWSGGRLTAEKAPDLNVHIGFVCENDIGIRAIATLKNGEQRSLDLQPCAPCPIPTEWQTLSPQESEVVRQCIGPEKAYRCSICGRTHSATEVRCTEMGSILGTPIYPTIESLQQRSGMILLRKDGAFFSFCPHPSPALRVGPDEVAMRSGNRATLYHYEIAPGQHEGKWRSSGQSLQQYHPLGQNTYALLL